MARGKQIVHVEVLDECRIQRAAEEFFVNNKVKGLAEATQKAYKNYVCDFMHWLDTYVTENILLVEITSDILDEFLVYKDNKGVKKVSQATIMNHLRRFFRFCHSRNYMNEIELTIPKYEKEMKEPYTAEELKLLLVRPKSTNWVEWRNWCMVNYFLATGQRLSTVLNIKRKDIDLENSTVKLAWNKDKIQKVMPLSSAIVKILQEYIKMSALDMEDYLFPEYEGKQLKKRSAEDAIADYNKIRGVEKTSIHLFRHTFAKEYILNGGNPAKLQKLLNHKTIEMTMKYVNLYSNDISKDLDLYNPLDNFHKNNYIPKKRKQIEKE